MVAPKPGEAFFLKVSVETWMTPKRDVLPNELFFLNKVDDTQLLSTGVVVAAASGVASTVANESTDWVTRCD